MRTSDGWSGTTGPSDLSLILERLGIRGESKLDLVDNDAWWFHVAAGRVAQLTAKAERLGRRRLQGRLRCAQAFPSRAWPE